MDGVINRFEKEKILTLDANKVTIGTLDIDRTPPMAAAAYALGFSRGAASRALPQISSIKQAGK